MALRAVEVFHVEFICLYWVVSYILLRSTIYIAVLTLEPDFLPLQTNHMLFHYSSVSQLAKLTDIFGIPETQLKFIIEAWSQVCYRSFYIMVSMNFLLYNIFSSEAFHHYIVCQIIECRRVLKWTYAYGYYLDDKVKSEFFEYLQGYYFY